MFSDPHPIVSHEQKLDGPPLWKVAPPIPNSRRNSLPLNRISPPSRPIRQPLPHPLHDQCGVRHPSAAFTRPPTPQHSRRTSASLVRSPRESVAPRTPPKYLHSNPKSPLTPVTLI